VLCLAWLHYTLFPVFNVIVLDTRHYHRTKSIACIQFLQYKFSMIIKGSFIFV